MTEIYYCTETGDHPNYTIPSPRRYGPNSIFIPGARLPAGTSDARADHERAVARAHHWSRQPDGSVILWVDM